MPKCDVACAQPSCRSGTGNARRRTSSRDCLKRPFDATAARATNTTNTTTATTTTTKPASSVPHARCGVQDVQGIDTTATTTTTSTTAPAPDGGGSQTATAIGPHSTAPSAGETVIEPPHTAPQADEVEVLVSGDAPQVTEPDRQKQKKQQRPPAVQEQDGQHLEDSANGNSSPTHLLERISSLEEMLLHMAALNRELELELIVTRRELAAYKQASQHVWRPPAASGGGGGGGGSSSNITLQERHISNCGSVSHPSDEANRPFSSRRQQQQPQWDQRNGIGALDAVTRRRNGENNAGCEGSRSSSVDGIRSPMSFPKAHPPSSRGAAAAAVAAGRRGRCSSSSSGDMLHLSGQGSRQRVAAAAAAAAAATVVEVAGRPRPQKAPQGNRLRSRSQSCKLHDPEELLDMLETLKRSIMYGCNHSHRHLSAEAKRPAAVPRRGTRFVQPPPCVASPSPRQRLPVSAAAAAAAAAPRVRGASVGDQNRNASSGFCSGVGSGRSKFTTTTTTAAAPTTRTKRVCCGVNDALNRALSPSSGSKKLSASKGEMSPSSSPPHATGTETAELEALQRKYWEQSREILDKLDHMLADD